MSRNYAVLVLSLTMFFLFADQNLMAPNLSQMADEFGFSDRERDEKLGGYVAFGFFIVGGPVALIVGYFADTVNRCILFAIVVTFGEIACLSTYWVQTYQQLLICRILTGISIGGSTPIIFSILGDLFPESARVYVSTIIGIAMSSGIAGGQLLAGTVGPFYGWRLPFLIVAIPAIILANLVVLTVSEPKRGSQEKAVRLLRQRRSERKYSGADGDPEGLSAHEAKTQSSAGVNPLHQHALTQSDEELGFETSGRLSDDMDSERSRASDDGRGGVGGGDLAEGAEVDYSERIEWAKLVVLFSTPSVWLIFLQGLPGCLPWGMVYVFLNDFFSEERRMTVPAATLALTLFGVGGLLGQLWGGWYGQHLYNADPRRQCVLMGLSTILAVLPMVYLLHTREVGDWVFYSMAVAAGVTISINGPNVRSVLQNVCIPEVRGCAFAVFMLTDDIGKGLGPAIVVQFIAAFDGDRQAAFTVVVLFWLFCGVMLLGLVFVVRADEQAVNDSVQASLLRRSDASAGLGLGLGELAAPDLEPRFFPPTYGTEGAGPDLPAPDCMYARYTSPTGSPSSVRRASRSGSGTRLIPSRPSPYAKSGANAKGSTTSGTGWNPLQRNTGHQYAPASRITAAAAAAGDLSGEQEEGSFVGGLGEQLVSRRDDL